MVKHHKLLIIGLLASMISGYMLAQEPIPPAANDESAPAAPGSDARALVSELIAEICSAKGNVRPPYDLAIHDMHLTAAVVSNRTMESLRVAAWERQKSLETTLEKVEEEWNDREKSGQDKADLAFLRYAFAKETHEEALAAADAAGPESSLRLARLFMAECRFEEAVRILAELAAGADPVATRALVLLAGHAEERKALANVTMLVPLTFDIEAFLAKKGKDPETAALISAARRSTRPAFSTRSENLPPISQETQEVVSDSDGYPDVSHWREDMSNPFLMRRNLSERSLDVGGVNLLLYTGSNGISTGVTTRLNLLSLYGGPLSLKVYRLEKRTEWEGISPDGLSACKPVQELEETIRALSHNNASLDCFTNKVEIAVPEEGYYVVTCTARYAPQMALCKFMVSHVALYAHVDRKSLLVAALDRRTGAPLSGVPFEAEVAGSFNAGSIIRNLDSSNQTPFSEGFSGASVPTIPAGTEADADRIRAAVKSFSEGRKLRDKNADIRTTLKGVTGKDGTVTLAVDLSKPDYAWHVTVSRTDPGQAEVSTSYSEIDPAESRKIVVWSDQPVYRPGGTVHLKGVVRRFTGTELLPAESTSNAPVQVKIESSDGEKLWSGFCPLSACGTFSTDFQLDAFAGLGGYSVSVDGQKAAPHEVFSVREYVLPSFYTSITLDQSVFADGAEVSGNISIYNYNWHPVPNAVAEVVLETGELTPPAQTVETDEHGHAHFSLPARRGNAAGKYTLRATTVDPSGQSLTREETVMVTADPFRLVVRNVDPDPGTVGQPAKVTVEAWTWDGKPLAGITVLADCSANSTQTDTGGIAVLEIPAEKVTGGDSRDNVSNEDAQIVRLTAIRGREIVRAEKTVRLVPAQVNGEKAPYHEDSLYIRGPGTIRTGQEMSVDIQVDNRMNQESTVLLLVKSSRLLEKRMLRVMPGTNTLSFKADSSFAPAVTVQCILFNGREKKESNCQVYVIPEDKFLSLEVSTDKTSYRPGELCKTEIVVLDSRSRPIPNAELSLGIVHSAVYDLKDDPTPDLVEYFWQNVLPDWSRGAYDNICPSTESLVWCRGPRYAWGYSVGSSELAVVLRGIIGSRHAGARGALLGAYGGGGYSQSMRIRKDFRTDAFWAANLITAKDGRAIVEFKFPDNVTEWRFTARGLTADTKIGEIRVTRNTDLPVYWELPLPRAFRRGDRITAAAVLNNNTREDVNLSVESGIKGSNATRQLTVASGRNARVDIPVDAKGSNVVLFAKAVSGSEGPADAIERVLPVLPGGYRVHRSATGMLKNGGVVSLDFGGECMPGSVRATVRIESSVRDSVESALDELIDYPYGCVEQTMSRFLPAVVAANAMKSAGIHCSKEKIIPDIVAKGISRLSAFQHNDGGWGWWENDQNSDFMTAYVLEGLALCRLCGYQTPDKMFERAITYLERKLEANTLSGRTVHAAADADIKLYAMHALAMAYKIPTDDSDDSAAKLKSLLSGVAEKAGVKPLSERNAILLADTFRLLGDNKSALTILAELKKCPPPSDKRQDLIAMANKLELGFAVEPANKEWPMLAIKLIQARKGGAWSDTLTSAAAVRALSCMITGKPDARVPVDILADGRVIATWNPDTALSPQVRINEGLDAVKELTIRAVGGNSDGFWSAQVEAGLKKPPARPSDPAVTINCRYFKVIPVRQEILPDSDGCLKVAPGQTLEVEMNCDVKVPLDYTRVSFMRPCGVELVRPPDLKATALSGMEERDEGMHFFATYWDTGMHSVKFMIRASVAGDVFAPPPEVAPMYDDAVPVSVNAATRWNIVR